MRRRHADIQRQRRVSINPAKTWCGAAVSRNIVDGWGWQSCSGSFERLLREANHG